MQGMSMRKSKIRENIRIHHSMLQIFPLKIFACCITAAFATAGCISQPTMKIVETPLIKSTSSAGPCVRATDMIHIDLKENYEGMERSLLNRRYIRAWLHYASIPKSMLPSEGDFAHLTITVKGKALSKIYRKVGRRYTGARVHLSLRLELHNGVVYHRHYEEKDSPGLVVWGSQYKDPHFAPFHGPVDKAIDKAMANMLAEVFGCDSLIPALMNISSSMRLQVKKTLKNCPTNWNLSKAARDAIPVFASTMKDKSKTVEERTRAIRALAEIGPPAHETIPALIEILQKERYIDLLNGAMIALRCIGPKDPAVLSALIYALSHYKNDEVLFNCVLSITGLEREAGKVVSELIKVLRSGSDSYGRIWAADILAEIGSPDALEAVPDLIRVLEEEWDNRRYIYRQTPRSLIEEALKKITGQDYDKIEQWKLWWNKKKN